MKNRTLASIHSDARVEVRGRVTAWRKVCAPSIIMNNLHRLSLENRNLSWRYFISQELWTVWRTGAPLQPLLRITFLVLSSHFISILQSRIFHLEPKQSGPREGVRCKMLVFYVKSPLAVMAVIPRLGDTDNLHNISCADSLGIVMMVIKITSFHSWPFFSK